MLHCGYDGGCEQYDAYAVCEQDFKGCEALPSGDAPYDEQNGADDSKRSNDGDKHQQRLEPVAPEVCEFARG